MPATYENYVNGEWITSESNSVFEVTNPTDATEVVGQFQDSTPNDVEAAIEAANVAQ